MSAADYMVIMQVYYNALASTPELCLSLTVSNAEVPMDHFESSSRLSALVRRSNLRVSAVLTTNREPAASIQIALYCGQSTAVPKLKLVNDVMHVRSCHCTFSGKHKIKSNKRKFLLCTITNLPSDRTEDKMRFTTEGSQLDLSFAAPNGSVCALLSLPFYHFE